MCKVKNRSMLSSKNRIPVFVASLGHQWLKHFTASMHTFAVDRLPNKWLYDYFRGSSWNTQNYEDCGVIRALYALKAVLPFPEGVCQIVDSYCPTRRLRERAPVLCRHGNLGGLFVNMALLEQAKEPRMDSKPVFESHVTAEDLLEEFGEEERPAKRRKLEFRRSAEYLDLELHRPESPVYNEEDLK